MTEHDEMYVRRIKVKKVGWFIIGGIAVLMLYILGIGLSQFRRSNHFLRVPGDRNNSCDSCVPIYHENSQRNI